MTAPKLEFALHYFLRGWSIIRTTPGTKKAAGSWKQFQIFRAQEPKLVEWYGNGRDYGLAVVLGQVSGGLVCRDFDIQEAYDRWAAAHPDLSKVLPTAATPRGRHVYFRAAAADLIFVDLPDGEYRGDSGHYCLLPPSRHPSGTTYTWLIPPGDGAIPFVADVRAAGLLASHVTERTERTECTEGTERTEGTECTEDNGGVQRQLVGGVCEVTPPPPPLSPPSPSPPSNGPVLSVHSVLSVTSAPDTERAIFATIPAAIGRRNRQVFELARALKAIPRFIDAPVQAMKPFVRQWHKIGLERGTIATEPFEETWIDFLHAWPKVKFPKGDEPMIAILHRAKNSPPPAVAENYEGDGPRLLVALCRELQRASGDKPFYLACRTAARLLGLDGENGYVKAWRWLDLLVDDQVIQAVEPGERGKRRATRYRYVGDSQA